MTTTTIEIPTPTHGPRIEKISRRWYAADWEYADRGLLRDSGGTWDPEMRGWYTGRRAVADGWQAILDRRAARPSEPSPEQMARALAIRAEMDLAVVTAHAAARTAALAKIHASGCVTWTQIDGHWVLTGPEALLRAGTVTVKTRAGAEEVVEVTRVRAHGSHWIASRVPAARVAPSYAPTYASSSSREEDEDEAGCGGGCGDEAIFSREPGGQ